MPDSEGMKAISASDDTSRLEYWRNLIQQQEASGESVHVFCAARGLTEQSLYYWRKRLRNEARPASFALVTTAPSIGQPDIAIELELGGGRRLRILRGVDAVTLRTVLTVLREHA